jgi:hypothetical protein
MDESDQENTLLFKQSDALTISENGIEMKNPIHSKEHDLENETFDQTSGLPLTKFVFTNNSFCI